MTLHDAIKEVFFIKVTNELSIDEIYEGVKTHNLYTFSEEALSIGLNQIKTRITKHPQLFKIENQNVSLINGSIERLKIFQNKLTDQLFSQTAQNSLFVAGIYFYLRTISNKEAFSHILNGDETKDLLGLYKFFQKLPRINAKYEELSADNIRIWNALANTTVYEDINQLFEHINVSETEYSNEAFNAFLREFVYTPMLSRKELFVSPQIVIQLFSQLTKELNFDNIYNPAAGICYLPIHLYANSDARMNFYGEELNETVYKIGLINLTLNGFDISNFEAQNSLNDNHPDKKFDLIVCNPPLAGKLNRNKEYDVPIKSTDISNVLIQRILQKRTKNGKAIIVVAERTLFSSAKADKELRKILVANNLIEEIISLPVNTFKPYSAVKTNILVIGETDPEGIKIREIGNEEQENIKSSNNLTIVEEPKNDYGNKKDARISKNEIDGNYNLVVGKFLNKPIVEESTEVVKLGAVCKKITNLKTSKDRSIPYVNIKDLNKNYFDLFLKASNVEYNTKERPGKLLNKDALLVGNIEGSFKPTLYKFEGKECLVSTSIYPLVIDTEKVNPEYLVFELASPYVEQQIKSLSYGATSLKRIRLQDLLSIKIRIPSLLKQEEILAERKKALVSAKHDDINQFADQLGVTKVQEKELLGFVKHEIDNIVGGVQNSFKNLKFTLKRLNIDFATKISKHENARTISQTMGAIESNLLDVNGLMTNIQAILDLGNEGLNMTPVSFKEFITEEFRKTPTFDSFNIHIYHDHEKIVDRDSTFLIDARQFRFVIKNFIQNSIVHGLIGKKKGNLIFHLEEDSDFYYLSLINDGKPFPDSFSLEDFLSFGKRFDNSKGSGIGGYLIGKVIENHNGSIELMEAGTPFFLNDRPNKPEFTEPNFIKVGVHFLITIPKNEI